MPALLPSELPVRARTRHHWVVLLRLPGRYGLIALAVAVLAAWVEPNPVLWALALFLIGVLVMRWRNWRAERILLTRRRVIRVQGLPETTETEAFLRLDRVSGLRIDKPFWGKVLGYGTIEITAPGDRQDVRLLETIVDPDSFYRALRELVLTGDTAPDPGVIAGEYVTEPLPAIDADRGSLWSRWGGHDQDEIGRGSDQDDLT